ncbi:MAG: hypothetical protein AAGG02_05440 [Cyanobacteria bacterium P01_H01_bin.15]
MKGKAIFDKILDELEYDLMSDVETEVMASFPLHEVEIECKRLDYPNELILDSGMTWIFIRHEDVL